MSERENEIDHLLKKVATLRYIQCIHLHIHIHISLFVLLYIDSATVHCNCTVCDVLYNGVLCVCAGKEGG